MRATTQYEDASYVVTEEWWFVAGIIQKINSLQSYYCIRLGAFYNCIVYNKVFTENGGVITVGGGFIGIIRKIKVFQYAKIQWES
mmetsp:Transcript_19784/g.14520  ORF Transcript_19784/g.14520 Transcript_19784/m.14520 type:complete len:85 (-) Transcript_19784:1542-1796(-)